MDSALVDADAWAALDAMARRALEGVQCLKNGDAPPPPDPELSLAVAALDAQWWATVDAGGQRG